MATGKLTNHFSTRTPSGVYVPDTLKFQADDWTRLERFLILGTEGGTFYASERKLTKENGKNVLKLVKERGLRVVEKVVEISQAGRAVSNDPALFALAIASAEGDTETRGAAYRALPLVARTASHLFTFIEYRKAFGGWGRGMRKAVSNWYASQTPENLAYQVVKYRERNGWSHRDVFRKAHPVPMGSEQAVLYRYITKGAEGVVGYPLPLPKRIEGYEALKGVTTPMEAASVVAAYDLPREAVPTQFLNSPEVWEALLYMGYGMPLTALVRNLGNMTKVGLLQPFSGATEKVVRLLGDDVALQKSRIHPMTLLLAKRQYEAGQGFRGKGQWAPVQRIVDALEDAFYRSFSNVEPTGKRIMLALDVSSSMWVSVAGKPITAHQAAAAMALTFARTEPNVVAKAFSNTLVDFKISRHDNLSVVEERMNRMPFGYTDASQPLLWAAGYRPNGAPHRYSFGREVWQEGRAEPLPVDAFIFITDNEVNAGIPPAKALREYRQKTGIPAKMVSIAMTAGKSSIADPNDTGMLDVVGFDSSVPEIIGNFIRD